MLWLVWSSVQTTTTFSISAVKLFHFHLYIHWSSTFHFLQTLSFTSITWLTDARGLGFQAISAFDMPCSLSLIISSFWFKGRELQLFLSLEQWGHYRIINWPDFNIAVPQGIGRPEKRKRGGRKTKSGEVRAHNVHSHVCHVPWVWCVVPQNSYNSNTKDHWSQVTTTNMIIMPKSEI